MHRGLARLGEWGTNKPSKPLSCIQSGNAITNAFLSVVLLIGCVIEYNLIGEILIPQSIFLLLNGGVGVPVFCSSKYRKIATCVASLHRVLGSPSTGPMVVEKTAMLSN